MRQKSTRTKEPAEKTVRDIRRRTRKQYSAEEKIRIVLEGLRGEDSIAALCRREGIAESLYYSWSKEFLEAGKKRLAGASALRGHARRGARCTPHSRPNANPSKTDLLQKRVSRRHRPSVMARLPPLI